MYDLISREEAMKGVAQFYIEGLDENMRKKDEELERNIGTPLALGTVEFSQNSEAVWVNRGIAIAIRVLNGTASACSRELENALEFQKGVEEAVRRVDHIRGLKEGKSSEYMALKEAYENRLREQSTE